MPLWQIILEYLKVFISWPSIIGILGIIFLIFFRKEISDLLFSIRELRTPGNFTALFEGLEEGIDIDKLLENYPKWRQLISLILQDWKSLKGKQKVPDALPSKSEELNPSKKE